MHEEWGNKETCLEVESARGIILDYEGNK